MAILRIEFDLRMHDRAVGLGIVFQIAFEDGKEEFLHCPGTRQTRWIKWPAIERAADGPAATDLHRIVAGGTALHRYVNVVVLNACSFPELLRLCQLIRREAILRMII